MKTIKRMLCLALSLLLLFSGAAGAEIFKIPYGVKVLGKNALKGVPLPDGILLPESLTEIDPDAFGDATVYGIKNGVAEAYALSRGLDFVHIDIENPVLDVPPFVSPFRAFNISVEAESVLPFLTVFRLYKDGALYFETEPSENGSARATLTEAGLYDYSVTLYNAYTQAEFFFEGETEVYEPIRLIKNDWYMAVGETILPVDETEDRDVTLLCDSDGLEIDGASVTARQTGVYTVTARTSVMDDDVFTDFTVHVVVPVESIVFDEPYAEIYVGDVYAPAFSVFPEETDDYAPEWRSLDESIATVDESGVIRALSQGECLIRLSTFDAVALLSVRVMVPCEEISLLSEEESPVLRCGDVYPLSYAVLPENADRIGVSWQSGNETVATVDEAGFVTAHAAGTARISVSSLENPSLWDDIFITVLPTPANIEADVPEVMYAGDICTLSVSVSPEGAGETVSFTSSDESVLSVSAEGVLTAHSGGHATITLSAGRISESFGVEVYERVTAIRSRIDALYLNVGSSALLADILYFEPTRCSSEGMCFASSDGETVRVSASGEVTGVKAGDATITVTLDGQSFALPVHVVSDGHVISSVASSPSYAVLTPGQTAVLTPAIAGADGKYKSGTWYSASPETVEIKSIASNGQATIRALTPGTARVYLVSSSGLSNYCEVTVNPIALKSITIAQSELTLSVGQSACVNYTPSPSGADTSGLFFYSSDNSVASVDDGGVIEALGGGTCEIFVSNGEIAAYCCVTVEGVPMSSAHLLQDVLTGTAGESAVIAYGFEPESASPARFIWTSDDEEIAEADRLSGTVWFKAAGETDVRGVAADGSALTLIQHVTVTDVPLRVLTLSQEELTLIAGESAVLRYSVYPQGASYSAAVFESSDESVVRVDESGLITAVRAGSAEVFVTAGGGSHQITKSVSVTVERATQTEYRALIMAEFTVPGGQGFLPFSQNSTRGVYDALRLSTIDGAGYGIRYLSANPTIETLRSAFGALAAEADEDDVTLIYLLTHGSHTDANGYFMQFANGGEFYANALLADIKNISGHVVLILCTCHSGRALQSSALSALRTNGGTYTGLNGQGHLSILCSSTDTRSTYHNVSDQTQAYDFFSKGFNRALGWDMIHDVRTAMLADKNGDGQITVSELFVCAKSQTPNLISAYVQILGTAHLAGDPNQYPSYYIADGEGSLVVYERH